MYKTAILGIFAVMILYAVALTPASSSAHFLPATLPIETILAQARVIHLEENNEAITGTLEITHVYCGPENILGKTFVAHSLKSADLHGRSISPPLQQGENGIWSLKTINGELAYLTYPQYGVLWPAREGENRYANAAALANVIEQICKAEPAKQLDMLEGYVSDRIPEISVWAINVMSLADPEDRVRLFNNLISNIDSLSIPGQAALDEVLSNIGDDPWRTSEKRLAFMNKWVSKAMSKDNAELLIQRLDIAAQHSDFQDKTILNLLQTAISNQGIPPVARQNGIWTVGLIAKRAKDDGLAFEYLVRIIKESDEEEFKISAAYTIKKFVSIDRDKLSIIQSLKATTTNKRVADALEEALKHPNNQ